MQYTPASTSFAILSLSSSYMLPSSRERLNLRNLRTDESGKPRRPLSVMIFSRVFSQVQMFLLNVFQLSEGVCFFVI